MRVRIVRAVLNLEVVLDDGETLIPVEVKPIIVPASQIDQIPSSLQASLAQFQQQIDEQSNKE